MWSTSLLEEKQVFLCGKPDSSATFLCNNKQNFYILIYSVFLWNNQPTHEDTRLYEVSKPNIPRESQVIKNLFFLQAMLPDPYSIFTKLAFHNDHLIWHSRWPESSNNTIYICGSVGVAIFRESAPGVSDTVDLPRNYPDKHILLLARWRLNIAPVASLWSPSEAEAV